MVALPERIDRYRILGELGRGAMGVVYLAHDPRLDRNVAVKTIGGLVEEGTAGDDLAARFEREARVAARLRHPNVVTVHDAGRDGDRLFLVLELVEGESLGARLARGDFPAANEALQIAAQAADALAAAHEAGVVHRDIKPGNLLLSKDGRTLVTDFGIAKALGETTELTRTGMVVGSPAYLSPEQVQGLAIDGRSDLFSLGVVLFEMVLRRKPFAAETFTSLVYQILTVDPLADGAELAALPADLADLLRSALAKDREHRLPDARQFAERAREIARRLSLDPEVSARTLVLAAQPAARSGRHGVAAAAGGLAVLVLVAIGFLFNRQPRVPAVGAPEAAALEASAPAALERPQEQRALPTPAPVEPAAKRVELPPLQPPVSRSSSRPAAEPRPPSLPAAVPEPALVLLSPAAPRPRIEATYSTRRAAEFDVSPEDAVVTIDGAEIGIADDWDGAGGGRAWEFTTPGEHLVRLVLDGYQPAWILIVVAADAEEDVVSVDFDLEEIE